MIKTELQSNNLDLRALLDAINNLPEKGSGSGEDITEELTAQDALISEISLALDEVAVAQADAFAAIGVTYPEGSTCTCSNGTKTLTAKDTSGQALFLVPEAGTWTVTATDSTNSKSQSVNISEESQFESVALSFSLDLLRGGVENSEVTGGLYYRKTTSENKITPSDGVLVCSPGGSYYNVLSSGNAFDVTGYKTLYVSVTLTGSAINYLNHIGLINKSTASSSLTNLSGYKQFVVSKTISTADYTGANMIAIDISTLSGEYKFAAGWCNETGQTTAKFYDIYLE